VTRHSEQFLHDYKTLLQVLRDKPLAALGDAYVNFVYSLALSRKSGKPRGKKVKGTPLAEAIRETGLRRFLPSRIDRHVLSDAAEALLVYAWLNDAITIEESVDALEKNDDLGKGFAELLLKAKEKIKL
jgi:hypothetical protein